MFLVRTTSTLMRLLLGQCNVYHQSRCLRLKHHPSLVESASGESSNAIKQQRLETPFVVDSQQKVNNSRPDARAQPVRYVIGLDFLERRTEGCNFSDTLRLTFYLQMPDANNPNSGLWKIRFRCNLYDTAEDIKLFEGHGLTEINEEVERAIKEAVAVMLRALQVNENSIPLKHDYVFYPQLSPELKSLSGCTALPVTARTRTTNEEVRQLISMSTAVAGPTAPIVSRGVNYGNSATPRTDECSFVTLEAPFRTHSLLAQINTHLRRAQPFLVLPENTQHPVVDLSMLSSSKSSTKIGDNVTLSINIREGMAPQTGSTLSQFQTQQMPLEVPSPHNPLMQNLHNSQQQFSRSEIPTSMSVCDQLVRQCMATLLSTNPSLFLATVAALSTNYIAAPQTIPTGLPNLQAPSPWSNSICPSLNAFQPSSASLLNSDAAKHSFLGVAMESAHQQQPMPTPCATTIPAVSTVPTATISAPIHPGLVSSTNVNAQNIIYEQIIWPNMPTKLVVVAPPKCAPQGQPPSSQILPEMAVTAPSVQTIKPQMTTVASTCMKTPTASVLSSQTPREGIVLASPVDPPPPPPSPSTSIQDIAVKQAVSLDSSVAKLNPMESSNSAMPPLPPPRKVVTQPVPLQTTPSDPNFYKKIPSKFTVQSAESDTTQCSESILLPHSTSDGTSTLAAPNATDSAPNISLSNTLRSSPPSENDLPSACPPPPSTPALSNIGSAAELTVPLATGTTTLL
ncbi:hypothetical protein TcWFU_008214 [Taenia crassiceps]|uniref:Uncharacterized protein n=1 Tax=Taenia crassiceps TaxID=6207 RepID=A0ABR4QJR6_9CEST